MLKCNINTLYSKCYGNAYCLILCQNW